MTAPTFWCLYSMAESVRGAFRRPVPPVLGLEDVWSGSLSATGPNKVPTIGFVANFANSFRRPSAQSSSKLRAVGPASQFRAMIQA